MRAAAIIAVLAVGCAPDFEDQPWLVQQLRVLAVIAEPPRRHPAWT